MVPSSLASTAMSSRPQTMHCTSIARSTRLVLAASMVRWGSGTSRPFMGTPYMPEMLIESDKTLTGLEKVGWLDIQTDTVSVSTMVYTELLEMFTSVTVDFSFDYAGNVESSVHLVTYKDLIRTDADTFTACLTTTCVLAFFSMLSLTAFLCRHPEQYNLGLCLYEIIARLVFVVYPLVMLISWTQQQLMSHEYHLLLDAFLHNEGMDVEHITSSIAEYFEVKSVIYEESSWLERHRIAAYAVLYVQFLQMVLAFNCAPQGGDADVHRV